MSAVLIASYLKDSHLHFIKISDRVYMFSIKKIIAYRLGELQYVDEINVDIGKTMI